MKKLIPSILLLPVFIFGIIVLVNSSRGKAAQTSNSDVSLYISDSPDASRASEKEQNVDGISNSISNEISLKIITPKNNAVVSSPSLKVTGTTSARAEVFVNDLETQADQSGNFSVTLIVDEGDNYIVVLSHDESGKSAETEFTLTYQTTQ